MRALLIPPFSLAPLCECVVATSGQFLLRKMSSDAEGLTARKESVG